MSILCKGCGFKRGAGPVVAVADFKDCCCRSCNSEIVPYGMNGDDHVEFCRAQKEKKAAEAAEDKRVAELKPVAEKEKVAEPKEDTHVELTAPSDLEIQLHFSKQKLYEKGNKIAEMQKTIDAQRDMLTVKDDRIAELEKSLETQEKYIRLDESIKDDLMDTLRKRDDRIAELEKSLKDVPTTSQVKDMEQEVERLKKENEELKKPPFFPRSELPGGFQDDEVTRTKVLLDIAKTEIASLRAQIEGLEHDKACLDAAQTLTSRPLIRESNGFLDPMLVNDPVAEIKKCQKIIAEMRGDLAEARINISKLNAQMVHFKKYRKIIVGNLRYRAYNCIQFNNSDGSITSQAADQVEQFLSVFPELRVAILKDLAETCFRMSVLSESSSHSLRANLIAYGNKLLKDGAEHSPASGSTPESG